MSGLNVTRPSEAQRKIIQDRISRMQSAAYDARNLDVTIACYYLGWQVEPKKNVYDQPNGLYLCSRTGTYWDKVPAFSTDLQAAEDLLRYAIDDQTGYSYCGNDLDGLYTCEIRPLGFDKTYKGRAEIEALAICIAVMEYLDDAPNRQKMFPREKGLFARIFAKGT